MPSALAGPATLPLQTRVAPIDQADVADRTIQVIWTTGASVVRPRGFPSLGVNEACDEVLLVTNEAVDLSRLRAGAAVLDSHQTETVGAQRAVVENAWLQSGKGYAAIRFPRAGIDLDSDRLLGLARDGIIRNVSVGYSLNRVRVVEPTRQGGRPQVVVERWTPYELSFVTVPADTGAQVINNSKRRFPVQVVGRQSAADTIMLAACRLRMDLRSDLRAKPDVAMSQYNAYLRARGIDPSGTTASSEAMRALRAAYN